ncbi:MAG: outer membrane beta-barrel protein, partial [Smithellaceae bacterium]|nr:outer membrane beta-barrel protein [Smithellaceae bacterium]
MKKSLFLVFIVFAFFLSSAAFAADTKGYFALKGGIFDPNDKTDGMKGFDNGTNFEAAYGMKVHPNITLEFGAGYYEAKEKVLDLTGSAIPLTITALLN